jgi:hypothetical protein
MVLQVSQFRWDLGNWSGEGRYILSHNRAVLSDAMLDGRMGRESRAPNGAGLLNADQCRRRFINGVICDRSEGVGGLSAGGPNGGLLSGGTALIIWEVRDFEARVRQMSFGARLHGVRGAVILITVGGA